MDIPIGTFTVYVALKLSEFLAYDWSIFSYLKALVNKLDVLSCGDMSGPLDYILYLFLIKSNSIWIFLVLKDLS